MKNWNIISYELSNSLLTKQSLTHYINSFWNDTFSNFDDNQFIALYIVIEYKNNVLKSLGKAAKINKNDLELFTNTILKFLSFKDNQYLTTEVVNIHFKYKFISKDQLLNNESIIHEPKDKRVLNTTKIFGYDLPNNMDIITWGNSSKFENNFYTIEFTKNGNNFIYEIERFKDHNRVVIKDSFNDDHILLEFTDHSDNGSLNNFTRKIKNMIYYFKDNAIILKLDEKSFKFITPLKPAKNNFTKFITFDIETRTINNKMVPYCICVYDGIKKYSYYLTYYRSSEDMITSVLNLLFTNYTNKKGDTKFRYNGYLVFAHNFSRFDSIFILKQLVKYTKENGYSINILKRDSDFVNINITLSNVFQINFRDSYLLLPGSLKNLAKSFKVEDKGIFPYNFVNNSNISLDYRGSVPEFKYFSNITIEQYNEYATKFLGKTWYLKYETIKYCLLDCKVLYQILIKFATEIFNDLGITLKYTPTISSLALRSYRTKFLKPGFNIPKITGETYNFINQSYTGGHVDVYNCHGYNLYYYDKNSLYPSNMIDLMPCGNPIYFEGDVNSLKNIKSLSPGIFDQLGRPYGFLEVKVTAPENLEYPILQTRVLTRDGIRTVAPLGTWTDVYSSSEIYNAQENFGYKFEIKRGYLFNRGILFKDFIDYFYEMKSSSSKDNPRYYIAKVILVSLYGKLGQDYKFETHLIVNESELLKLIQSKSVEVSSILDLGQITKDNLSLISYLSENKFDDNILLKSFNGSKPGASETVAKSRINMSLDFLFCMNNGYIIYYMDTDSMVVNKPLPDWMISNTVLGKLKLEHVINEGVFLAPKVYAFKTSDGKEIIKVKGLSHNTIQKDLTFEDMKSLLQKDKSLILNQTKSNRDFGNSTINLLDQTYELIPTENKRELVYENNLLIKTRPYIIGPDKTIK